MQTIFWSGGIKGCRMLVKGILLGSFLVICLAGGSFAQNQNLKAQRAQEAYKQAVKMMKQGKSREAIPLLEGALRELPDNNHLKADYVSAMVWSGYYRRAIKYYESHSANLRKIKYLSRNIAKAYFELKDYKKALAFYEKAFAANRSDQEAFKGIIYTS